MRASVLTVSSLALVATAAVAIIAPAQAMTQEVPVVYRTDPGEAHPRYADPAPVVENAAPMHRVSGTPAQRSVVGTAAPSVTIPNAVPMAPSSRSASAYEVSASYAGNPVYQNQIGGTISVVPGDTVYGIGRRYGVAPNAIIAANRLAAPYKLAVGQTIVLPGVPSNIAVASQVAVPTQVAMATSASPTPVPTAARTYQVRQGDTLYSLSRMFGVDVATLANANSLYAPYRLTIDQRLQIPSVANAIIANDIPQRSTLPPLPEQSVERPAAQAILVSKNPGARFAWPIRGAVIRQYGVTASGERHDGINIAAPVGAPIRAADEGEVVYTGAELEGYGNLLLIRHDGGWVSAYAHTDSILVRKGERVRQGQVVAKVGTSGNVDQPQLHFELRHDLQPRDPMQALTGQDRLARVSYTD